MSRKYLNMSPSVVRIMGILTYQDKLRTLDFHSISKNYWRRGAPLTMPYPYTPDLVVATILKRMVSKGWIDRLVLRKATKVDAGASAWKVSELGILLYFQELQYQDGRLVAHVHMRSKYYPNQLYR